MPGLRKLRARYRGRCRTCKKPVGPGEVIYYDGFARRVHCQDCGNALYEAQRQPSQPSPPRRYERSNGRLAFWTVVLVGVLFSIGLSSDRLWPATFVLCVICGVYRCRARTASDARVLLIASISLIGLASGSITRDYLDGGLLDHAPTARCRDGSYSYSQHHGGTCSWHGGVVAWNPAVPWWRRM
jgi:hypothetical protein